MKGQLSFEFMIYIAVSAVSLAIAIPLFARGYFTVLGQDSIDATQMFVAQVNSNMGYYTSEFSAYIPPGICNTTTSSYSITSDNTTYYFSHPVYIDTGSICHMAGNFGTLKMQRLYNGTFAVSG